MKKAKFIPTLLGAMGLFVLVLSGCNTPVSSTPSSAPSNSGKLTISLGANTARSLVPTVDMNVTTYNLTGTGPSGANMTANNVSGNYVATLAVGAWKIVATGLNAAGTSIVSGTVNVTVVANTNTPASIVCTPIAGPGTLNLSLNWPTGLLTTPSVVATLTPTGGSTQNLTFTVAGTTATYNSTTLTNGYYTLSLQLEDTSVTPAKVWWGDTETVEIIASQPTTGSWTLTNAVLTGTVPAGPVTGVTLNKGSTTLAVNGTEQLFDTILPANAADQKVTWSTSAATVATVSATGLVTGVSAGSATITVTTDDGAKTASCAVTVTATPVSVTGLTVAPTTASVGVGSTQQLTATIAPANATNQNVTWSSDTPTVATVSSSGLVTAVAAGTANIKATSTDGSFTGTCAVTVYPLTSTGGVNLSLSSNTQTPLTVTLSGYTNCLKQGASMTVIASTSVPYMSNTPTYVWSLNGTVVPNQASSTLTLGSTLTSGMYWLSAVATATSSTGGATTSGSATVQFSVSATPTTQIVQTVAGQNFTAALKSDGTLWLMGYVPGINALKPIEILSNVQSVSSFWNYTGPYSSTIGLLAVKTDASLWSFFYGNATQIMTGVQAVASGSDGHTLILKADGSVWAMGNNTWGQIGDGSTTARTTPVQVLTGAIAVTAGVGTSFAIKADHSLYAWGYNGSGQLGVSGSYSVPAAVLTNVAAVSASQSANYNFSPQGFTLALLTNGNLMAFGYNAQGQLGNGTTTSATTPILTATNVIAMAAGNNFSAIVKNDGTLWTCGDNTNGELGLGTSDTTVHSSFQQVATGVTNVSAFTQLAVLKNDYSLWTCGTNTSGELGIGASDTNPHPTLQQAYLP